MADRQDVLIDVPGTDWGPHLPLDAVVDRERGKPLRDDLQLLDPPGALLLIRSGDPVPRGYVDIGTAITTDDAQVFRLIERDPTIRGAQL